MAQVRVKVQIPNITLNGISPHGCYDMVGNVDEWTASLYEEGQSRRVVRGGSWVNYHGYARCALRYRLDPRSRNYDLGVRVSRTL